MAGLLNSQPGAQAPAAPAAGQDLQDPLLQQVESGIEQSVPDQIRAGYDAIVNAGMDIMFSKATNGMMVEQLQSGGDIVKNVSEGIAGLLVMIYNESQGKMQLEAMGPASVTLMCMALDFWEKTGGGQVTQEIVGEATKQTMFRTLEKFGITGEQLQKVMAAGQQVQAQQGGAQPQPTEV